MSDKANYVFFNPHPKNEYTSDCVKRALVKFTGRSYKQISDELSEHRKITGVRCYNDNPNPHSFAVSVLGLSCVAFNESERVSVRAFCKSYPEGEYIVSTNGHWAAVVDGVIYDTFDCSNLTVYGYYVRPENKL